MKRLLQESAILAYYDQYAPDQSRVARIVFPLLSELEVENLARSVWELFQIRKYEGRL